MVSGRRNSFRTQLFIKGIHIFPGGTVNDAEAHCISQWGQDFRPSYLKIVQFIRQLGKRPVISAFTATATETVKEDIICVLGLQEPEVLVTGFDRKNLYFAVEMPKKKDSYVIKYCKEHAAESGIIYCATRKNVDALYRRFRHINLYIFPNAVQAVPAANSSFFTEIMQDIFPQAA